MNGFEPLVFPIYDLDIYDSNIVASATSFIHGVFWRFENRAFEIVEDIRTNQSIYLLHSVPYEENRVLGKGQKGQIIRYRDIHRAEIIELRGRNELGNIIICCPADFQDDKYPELKGLKVFPDSSQQISFEPFITAGLNLALLVYPFRQKKQAERWVEGKNGVLLKSVNKPHVAKILNQVLTSNLTY